MTSTLDVFELSSPSRVPLDQRVLDALYPDVVRGDRAILRQREDGERQRPSRDLQEGDGVRARVREGGRICSAPDRDPCCISAIAGYGDQRNYELLIEAGFTPEQAIQIMTANGAKILGFDKWVGTIQPGMQADLVVVAGDPVRTPADIRNTEIVFRRGIGFDSAKLRESVKGMVGLR